MFRILVIDKRESVHSIIKYLLYRYELMFSYNAGEAINRLKENSIDMIILNLPYENGMQSARDLLREWTSKKKTIAVTDVYSNELLEEAKDLGALVCIDKLEITRLPELVSKHLNQADTKILDISPHQF